MNIIKEIDSVKFIPISNFDVCVINNFPKKYIMELYPSRENGAYYLDKFNNYLKDNHGMDIKEYCVRYLNLEWPKCPTHNIDVGFKINGRGIVFSKFSRGGFRKEYSEKFTEHCKRMSIERRGSGNPMYGKQSWNSGLDINHPSIAAIAEKRRGRKASEHTKKKQRDARAKSAVKARHTTPHSEETREFLRKNTARLWAEGIFNRVSSIHIKMREFLKTLSLNYEFKEEYQVKYFSLDFAFPDVKVGIECQGSFYHVDPRIYPNGPVCAIQRRNFGRDKAKKKVLEDYEKWTIIPVWETEINDGTFKEDLKCRLKELSILKS